MNTILLVVLLICLLQLSIQQSEDPSPDFPLQFSATLVITAHLIEEESDYPPRTRRLNIIYDYINKRARADIEAGYEAAKFYIRQYDTKNEYMIRLPPIDDCKRSYLGEKMPFPEIPPSKYIGQIEKNDVLCNYWIFEEFEVQLHIYLAVEDNGPIKLIQANMNEIGVWIPMLTYDFLDVSVGEPESSWFDLPEPYQHKTCQRHIGGFPYLHVFHYFVRF